jgi:hypothetical protein
LFKVFCEFPEGKKSAHSQGHERQKKREDDQFGPDFPIFERLHRHAFYKYIRAGGKSQTIVPEAFLRERTVAKFSPAAAGQTFSGEIAVTAQRARSINRQFP